MMTLNQLLLKIQELAMEDSTIMDRPVLVGGKYDTYTVQGVYLSKSTVNPEVNLQESVDDDHGPEHLLISWG